MSKEPACDIFAVPTSLDRRRVYKIIHGTNIKQLQRERWLGTVINSIPEYARADIEETVVIFFASWKKYSRYVFFGYEQTWQRYLRFESC